MVKIFHDRIKKNMIEVFIQHIRWVFSLIKTMVTFIQWMKIYKIWNKEICIYDQYHVWCRILTISNHFISVFSSFFFWMLFFMLSDIFQFQVSLVCVLTIWILIFVPFPLFSICLMNMETKWRGYIWWKWTICSM